ncbi:MAG: N-acetyltransferase [Oligoflexia bacterium]|nr:N-acetyltransferase [Oligoflexia bacterium]
MNSHDYYAHPRALIDDGANIGKGTRVWANAHVMSKAIIGENCNIGDYAFIESGAKLGNNVTVKNGVQVWEGLNVEDGVFLGPNSVFTNDMFPRSFLKRPKEDWLLPTHLKEGCTIGANATIICGITVGRFAFICAGAVVTKDVPDYAMVMGNPAKFYSWICKCGEKLEFKSDKTSCKKCDTAYKIRGETQVTPLIPK